MVPDRLKPYLQLIESFLGKNINALEFERNYLDLFLKDPTHWPRKEYVALEILFEEVDAFCADPSICGPDDIDEEELRRQCAIALDSLKK